MVDVGLGAQGGDLRALPPGSYLDLSTCVNRYGPSPRVVEALRALTGDDLRIHPYGVELDLVRAYARKLGVDACDLVPGRGTTGFIWALSRSLSHSDVAVPLPAYTDFLRAFPGRGGYFLPATVRATPNLAQIEAAMESARVVVISNPNNPCGTLLDPDGLVAICRRFPNHVLVVDESYVEFLAGHGERSLAGADVDNLVVLQSPSKFYGIAGARTGIAWTRNRAIRSLFAGMEDPWPLSLPDVRIAVAALEDDGWASEVRSRLVEDGRSLETLLGAYVACEPAAVHYRFFFSGRAPLLREALLKVGIVSRALGAAHGVDPGGVRLSAPRSEERAAVEEKVHRVFRAHGHMS